MLPLLVLATFYTKAEQLRAINPSATAQQSDTVGASATANQPDTLTVVPLQVQQYLVMKPFISDSLNVQGKAYDATDLLKPVNHIKLSHAHGTLPTAQEGVVTLRTTEDAITTYAVRLRTPSYEQATLQIETTVPFVLALDGDKLSSATQYQSELKVASPASLTLTPGRSHLVTLQLLTKGGESAQYRLKLIPAKADSQIEVRHDDKEYLSLEYMMTGRNLYSVSVSPTGRYTLLTERETTALKSSYRTYIYQGNKLLSTLSEQYRFASWMPKEDKLYRTSTTDDGRQLISYDPKAQEERVVAEQIPTGSFFMMPDGKQLLYTIEEEGPARGKITEQVLGRYDRMADFRKRTFLALYDLESGRYQPLTFGHRSTYLQDVSPDAREIIFSTSEEITEIPFSQSNIYTMNLETLEVKPLFTKERSISSISYTALPHILLIQGDANAFGGIGRNLPDGMITNTYDGQLFLYDRQSQQATPLTKDFDPAIKRVKVSTVQPVAYFTAENKDRISLYRLDLRRKQIEQVATTEDLVRSFDISDDASQLAYYGQSAMNADRFYSLKGKRETLLYDLAKSKMQDLELGSVSDWVHTMPNGDKVEGRYYLPPHFDATKQYPMIVYYYGGTSPTTRFFEGSYSLPMYAAQGYVVLTLNPSGTTGFGQEYAARHVNAWGKVTADEIVSATKQFCQEHPYVNAKKIGCMGASYGGFMTQYLQTITDIFAAAISHAGISALSSYWGEGTWGIGYSTVASYNSYPWNNPQLYTEQSPLFHADKIHTPLLLIHGTDDTNVPIGESIQMYNALKILGREVAFVKVHGEDHIITAPEKKIEWTNTLFAWFQKWLKDDPTWWNARYPEAHL